jgi:hypothetical protein
MDKTANFAAGGDIYPCRFVKSSTTAEFTALQTSATTDLIIGVSIESQFQAPTVGNTDTRAAFVRADGQPMNIGVWPMGSICNLQIGSGGCAVGDKLTSDSTGRGITASSSNIVGAVALQSANIDEQIAVLVNSVGVKA